MLKCLEKEQVVCRERLLGLRRYRQESNVGGMLDSMQDSRCHWKSRTRTLKVKGFEFQVKVSKTIRPKALHKLITHTCEKIERTLLVSYLNVHIKILRYADAGSKLSALWMLSR